jgi:hypothetical protein
MAESNMSRGMNPTMRFCSNEMNVANPLRMMKIHAVRRHARRTVQAGQIGACERPEASCSIAHHDRHAMGTHNAPAVGAVNHDERVCLSSHVRCEADRTLQQVTQEVIGDGEAGRVGTDAE